MHDSVDFADRLQRSIEILRGNRDPDDGTTGDVSSLSEWPD
jgi:hypothetical protein